MGYRKAASAYAVPQTTLARNVQRMIEGLPLGPKKNLYTPKEDKMVTSATYGRMSV